MRLRIVTAPPYYPEWKVASEHRARWFRRERRNGVEVIRCPTWVPVKPRGLTRMLHLASFAVSSIAALIASLPWRPDLVINIAPTLASAPGAWAFARIGGAKCWLHVQDFEVDAAMDMGIVDAGPLRRVALAVERVLLRRFDVVSTISPKMIERLADKGVYGGMPRIVPQLGRHRRDPAAHLAQRLPRRTRHPRARHRCALLRKHGPQAGA